MVLPVPKDGTWDAFYDFFWVPCTPPASAERATADAHIRHAAAAPTKLSPAQVAAHFRKFHGLPPAAADATVTATATTSVTTSAHATVGADDKETTTASAALVRLTPARGAARAISSARRSRTAATPLSSSTTPLPLEHVASLPSSPSPSSSATPPLELSRVIGFSGTTPRVLVWSAVRCLFNLGFCVCLSNSWST